MTIPAQYLMTAVLCATSGPAALAVAVPGSLVRQQDPAEQPRAQQTPAGIRARDAIDARAAEDRRATALLRRTRQRIREDDWGSAIQQLQSILNQPSDALIWKGDGRFGSMRSEANRLLGGMPRGWKQRYQQQFGAAAERQLDEALASGDFRTVGDVATRYLHTPAGRTAARALVLRHLDRREFGMALRWLELRKLSGAQDDSETERLLNAMARTLSARKIESMPRTVVIEGRQFDAVGLLSEMRAEPLTSAGRRGWHMLMGDAARSGLSVDRQPLMVESWSQPLLAEGVARDNAERILRRVLNSQPGLVPASVPIVVGDRLVCRTIHGVSVFHTATGELLWRTRPEPSTVAHFSGRPGRARTYGRASMGSRDEVAEAFLFRDGVHGLLSSDGERLFVIEQQGMPTQSLATSRFQNSRSLQLVRQNSRNLLVAYDLKSGALRWSVGGPDSEKLFQPTLAGEYFHGVPVARDGELFVVGEKDNAVRLHALDATTGELKWSQLLAYSDTRIERDLPRRYWTAQITIAEGMLICPTTVDWLVAVDPLTRGILWAHRARGPGVQVPSGTQQASRGLEPLTGQWPPSAPIVIGDRVIHTPSETDVIDAVDFITGERVWSQKKSDLRYVAGVSGEKIITVALNSVSARRASDGHILWSTPLESDFPAGRGVLTGRHLHQPTAGGKLLTLRLSDGQILSRNGPPRSERLFANMVMSATGAFLQTPTGIEAYELRPESGEQPALTPLARLRRAEILFADGSVDEAVSAADAITPEDLDNRSRARRTKLLVSALRSRVEQGAPSATADLQRLEKLAGDRWEIARLRVLMETNAGNHAAAFDQLINIYREQSSSQVVELGRSRVGLDPWLLGRLADAWDAMAKADRVRFDERVAALAEADDAGRFLQVFAFHPVAHDLLFRELEKAAGEARFVEAEATLRLIRRFAEDLVPAAAFTCASGLAQAGQFVDARSLLGEYAQFSRADDLAAAPNEAPRTDGQWEAVTFAGSNSSRRRREVPVYRSDVRFHRDHICFSSATEQRRLHFYSRPEGRVTWSLPLRYDSMVRQIRPNGRSLLVAHGRMLSCIAPLERRILWELPVRMNVYQRARVFMNLRKVTALMQPAFVTGRTTPLAISNEDYICLHEQTSIEVRDAVTGVFRWSRDDIGPNDSVFGTTEVVFVRSGNRRPRAFRASDGRALPDVRFTTPTRIFAVIGRGFLLAEESGFLFRKTRLRLFDPLRSEDIWTLEYPPDTLCAVTDAREMIVKTGPATLDRIDLVTGEQHELTADGPLDDSPLVVATTPDHVFLASITSGSVQFRTTAQNVSGVLRGFSRQTGEQLWRRDVNNGAILLEHFRSLPALLMTENEEKIADKGGTIWDCHLVSPLTGQTLATHRIGSRFNSGHPTHYEPESGYVEVLISNRRFRFRQRGDEDQTPAADEPPRSGSDR